LQTTLLGLAIAIILALLAALVGPLLIDWGGHRSLFEAQASRLIGVDVRVTGAIDARLLPSPRLTLHDIEIGKTGGKTGGETMRANSLGIEFALGPLMRGEWRATELHLAGPQISLGLDASGHVKAPNIAVGFDPDALAIDRLSIEDGKVTLADAANGASVTLDRLWFNGEARSLIGPLKGEAPSASAASFIRSASLPRAMATTPASNFISMSTPSTARSASRPTAHWRCPAASRISTAHSVWRGRSGSHRAAPRRHPALAHQRKDQSHCRRRADAAA